MRRFSLSIDIGGTFTDFVLLDREQRVICTDKILTTPRQPETAVLQGMRKLAERDGLDLRSTDLFLHATTIITNAVIERTGSDFILLFTSGFRDLLEIGREHRYNLTDLKLRFSEPLSRRHLRLSVKERVSAAGEVLLAPRKDAFQAELRSLADRYGIRSFAVCFLHSYRNPANEELVRRWIEEAYPEAHASCSATVTPTQREYERWTTCCVDAYTKPLLVGYVGRLQAALMDAGFSGRALMMTSSGLPIAFDRCIEYPVRMIESGPAAGVLAAREIVARNASCLPSPACRRGSGSGAVATTDVLAFDMGGTTAKGAFLSGGALHVKGSLEVGRIATLQPGSGLPLMIPAIDLIEIGAGGGSIAVVDERGVIAVGPSSAGADPGPACYGRGGTRATLTDANLALGYLSEDNFRGSGIEARRELAWAAIERTLARPLGSSIERVARGIRDTVNENVARAFRVHASELGIDYRRYRLVCTGGSAPLHAAEIARILGIRTVLVPLGAGVASAFGLFAGTEGITVQKTNVTPLHGVTAGRVAVEVRAMIVSDPYAAALAAAGGDVVLTLGMRYLGQGYEIAVRIADLENCDGASLREAFQSEYRKVFGVVFLDYSLEIFNWTVQVTMRGELSKLSGLHHANVDAAATKAKARREVMDGGGGAAAMPVYNRYGLRPGDLVEGSALIEENDATIYLPSFARGVITETFDLLVEIGARRGARSDATDA
jgi:N-methylhydantoinase A